MFRGCSSVSGDVAQDLSEPQMTASRMTGEAELSTVLLESPGFPRGERIILIRGASDLGLPALPCSSSSLQPLSLRAALLSIAQTIMKSLCERQALQDSASKVWNKLLKLTILLLSVECTKSERITIMSTL